MVAAFIAVLPSMSTWHADLPSPQSSGIEHGARFSLRTLLVVITGVGLILGYWVSLPRILPEWDRLLSEIAAAKRVVAERGMLAKPAAFSTRVDTSATDFVVGTSALVAFYVAKNLIACRLRPWAVQLVAYVMIVSLFLPYMYLYWEDWGDPHVYFVGNWLGGPIAILFVPTVTFIIDLLSRSDRTTRWLLVRSAIEIVVAIPVWSIIWGFFSFFVLGFGWI